MRIRAILRFRNEDLTRKRLMAGFKTQKELADFLSISQNTLSSWETFKDYPKKKKMIEILERTLNCDIDEIFPPEFIKAIKKKIGIPLEKVIDVKQLPGYTRGELLLPSPEEAYELKEKMKLIENALEMLTEREVKIIKLRFGLGGGQEHTLEEIGQQFRVSGNRIRQIEAKALRKLTHLRYIRELKDFV